MILLYKNDTSVITYSFKDSEILKWEGGHLSFPVNALDVKPETHSVATYNGEVPDDFKRGLYKLVDGELVYAREYTELELEEVKSVKVAEVEGAYQKTMLSLVSDYHHIERETWTKQEEEARSFLADPNSATPMLDALSAQKGEDKTLLANKIVGNADAFASISGYTTGKFHRLLNEISSASTLSEINQISW